MSTSGGTGVARAGNPFTTLAVENGGMYSVSGALRRWRTKARPALTTNTVAILAGDTTWTVSSSEGFNQSGTQKVYVGTEEVLVTAGLGTTTWTVLRGVNGTTAAGYGIGSRITSDPIIRIALLGDSTVQGGENGVVSDGYGIKLARYISQDLGFPLLSTEMGQGGFYPVYHSSDPNIGGGPGNSGTVWTAQSGSWTLITPGDVKDRGPFGWAVTANSSANVLLFTTPGYLGSIRAVDIYYVNSNFNGFSADINLSGAWANAVGAGGAPSLNKVCRARFTSGADITQFRIRAAASGGAATTPVIIGIDVWPTAPTFGTTTGVKMYNIGKDADFLSTFCRANAGGDDFGTLDSANLDPGAIDPDIVIIGSFTNDVLFWGSGALYRTNLQSIITRCFPRSDVVCLAFAEQNGRSVTDQASLRASVKQVAKAAGVAGIDIYDDLAAQGVVGWAAANTAGYMAGDNLHFDQQGMIEEAAAVGRLLQIA